MKTFKKKQVVVQAVQFNNINLIEIESFVGVKLKCTTESDTAYEANVAPPISSLTIETKEGDMKAFPGDWIIKEPFPTGDRDFYPCKDSIFKQTYDDTITTLLNTWISVKDAMPELEYERGIVMIAMDVNEDCYHAAYSESYDEFVTAGTRDIIRDVRYWMLLTKPTE